MHLNFSINKYRLAGGMERYLFDILGPLLQDGHSAEVHAAKFDAGAPYVNQISRHKIAIKWLPKSLRVPFFSRRWQKSLKPSSKNITLNLCQNADLVICGGTHKGYCQNRPEKTGFYDRAYIASSEKAYDSAKHIMAHSRLMQRELIELYGISPDKISVLYPPADTARFQPNGERAPLHEQFDLSKADTLFLFPSTGHKRKGLALLQKVFNSTDLPVKLLVAGSPVENPGRNVIACGFVKDIAAYYRAADFTILASSYEPFGLAGIETLLCGTKAVMADNLGCTEVYSPEAGFLFNRQDEQSLHDALAQAAAAKQAGTHRLENPAAAFTGYDPSVQAHVALLYQLLAKHC